MRWIGVAALIGALAAPLVAAATETISYTYDKRGRLIGVQHSGSVTTGSRSPTLTMQPETARM